MSTSRINPYQSPQAEAQPAPIAPSRTRAARTVYTTLLILTLPAAANLAFFLFYEPSVARTAPGVWLVIASVNAAWMLLLFAALWLFGLKLIEAVAVGLHHLFGGVTTREDWLDTMYRALWPMIPASALGGLLWIAWLSLYFLADHPGGYATDVIFQCAAHLLGAWVYLNVFVRWYLLRKTQ